MSATTFKRRQAAGYTLIEMLVTIALGSIITGLSATLLVGLLRTEKAGRQHAVESRTLERLGRQCRADAHRASVSDLPPRVGGPAVTRPICSLSDPAAGVQIDYEQRSREVVRRELREGRLVRHEVYRFP
ncbi:MAG: prepilin-type N-terminal cleavage/methylation domain-containing protein, partial [Planctomycetaceae bacterium]|nr:prepilin-type N-terminal cleavage/methylation domain-containing protein [Planctomycetaceae bacterium]